ncbi:phage virion morphogenesis protein [Neisseriaceae bacterium B1]
MNQALDLYIDRLDQAIQQISPAQTHQLMRKVGAKIRQANKYRIKANIAPNGNAFTPAQADGRKTRRLRVGQNFLLNGKLHRYRTLHDYGDYYIGWDFENRTTIKAQKDKIRLPTGDGRKRQMFRKIHQYKYLQLKAQSHEAAIGFLNGLTAYIAAAHQYGEDNRPERHLLGFSDEDLNLIETLVMQHFQFKSE